jgi:hypothetical protein
MHNQIANKIFASTKHQRFHWQTDRWHQHTVFYAHAKEVTKCWRNPTLCCHFIWPYLIYKWCSICRPLVFWLLHTVEKFNTEKPADGNGSKGNSQCFQIIHIERTHTRSGSLAECLCKDHIQRLWFGSTTEFLIERENLWYQMVLKASHASTRTEVIAVPLVLYTTTKRMCIDKTDTSKDNNQLWMRQQNLLLWENIPCICWHLDEATLLAGGRARRE